MSNRQPIRAALITYLQRELVGPVEAHEELQDNPLTRYVAGVLFPAFQPLATLEDVEEDAEGLFVEGGDGPAPGALSPAPGEEPDDTDDEAVLNANSYTPSAMGVTCVLSTACQEIIISPCAAVYEPFLGEPEGKEGRRFRRWRRRPLDLAPQRFVLPQSGAPAQERDLTPGLALRVVRRAGLGGARLVTVVLFNKHQRTNTGRPDSSDCFFQVGFRVEAADESPAFQEYAQARRTFRDPEEASLALLYRNRKGFALGHGCAADWGGGDGDRVSWIESSVIPAYTIPPVQPRQGFEDPLNMEFLAGLPESATPAAISAALGALNADYAAWIGAREAEVNALPDALRGVAADHLAQCRHALARMQQGVALLEADEQVMRAFTLANHAMLMQQHHFKRPRRAPGDAPWQDLPSAYTARREGSVIGYWRTFQISFLLMNLRAMADPGCDERQLVDLIWFPTGGGKTEAYLGLAAFTLFLRRLRDPRDNGCGVLMRYTLRLLTAQQFQRAAALICACEHLRATQADALGANPISIGLWVGESLTPNQRKAAVKSLKAWKEKPHEQDNAFQILSCPWCGTAMDSPDAPGYVTHGFPETVIFRCPESRCPHAQPHWPLPIKVIDEDIYEVPPSLIIGTVDKFAMLAWRAEAGALLGLQGGQRRAAAPDLIIQDELHLISGPLGTMVGLYEAAIDYLCTRGPRAPKIVASTATIRRAEAQCRALYNRPVSLFPPSGIDIADNFFSREAPDSPGRVYVGILPTAAPSPVTALVRTSSGLLQGIGSVPLPDGCQEEDRDPWWTLAMYFNSLRELGRAATLVEADIPEYLKVMRRRYDLDFKQLRNLRGPVELTSRRTAQEIPEVLAQLERSLSSQPDAPRPIDTLLATNMIAVGVDVERLGLMLIVGQPKTTSEYIQASSRVGRSSRAPGLVVTLYNAGKPRDRSHYEQFRSYHAAFYRHVEPTSVTPFSPPALERALGALLIIAARHVAGFTRPDAFHADAPDMESFMRFLRERALTIDPDHADALVEQMDALVEEWESLRGQGISAWGSFFPTDEVTFFRAPGVALPDGVAEDEAGWIVPTSMRSVDKECVARLVSRYTP